MTQRARQRLKTVSYHLQRSFPKGKEYARSHVNASCVPSLEVTHIISTHFALARIYYMALPTHKRLECVI